MAPSVKSVDIASTASAYHAAATVSPAGKLLHISGQPGTTKDGAVPNDYESQIHLALLNLRKIIIAAGASIKDIVKLNVLIVNYDPSNRKHTRHIQRFLAGHRPAITLVPVTQLAIASWLVEIDAVVAIPEPSLPPSLPQATETVDVVIVGAGLAGLSAAHEVLRAGLSCVVLEARDRVGGKTWSQPLQDKGVVELGAAWINDVDQQKVYGLAKRYGADLIEQNTQGDVVLQDFDGSCSPFTYGDLPNFDAATRAHIAFIRDKCEADCQALDAWRPNDNTLDSLTFEAYLRASGADDAAVATATVWTRAMLGQDPRDMSALFFLNYCKSGGGLLQMRSDRKGGGQHLRIRQGTQFFSLGLASDLPEKVVRLSCPVDTVIQNVDRSLKVQAGGVVYAARKLITTVPTPALKNITFYPKLPPAKQMWIESTTYGYYTKAMMVFSAPFWIERGFCGLAQSYTGPASVVRDTSSPADQKYVLTCFMAADFGRAWAALSAKEREQQLLAQLEKLFGVSNLQEKFIELVMYEWVQDQWAGWGCPSTSMTPGVLATLGGDALRDSCGDIHFAGTETAGEWKGYMEGAIRSGERAAAEVIKGLNGAVSRL
ncbi:hypothetical protein P175DRAFT_0465442 [Aspergillus ochraceoroseus IBT 24754]|uniref:Amine oxidase n=3 Tax=Aspergillus subgen. Nidulantes TaxID=2720870 RepID=A0A0F8UYF1_9EURO|nr:uncharacterized protein P175DRAFT_0465442 [Aspergillus ochraceoroseus IBT 24754]KKK15811.1 hypothetical protein ARAM_007578 [Aspergillus rambellii]KKK22793.1 hypothetical protein AOCH_007367 [Aspergillus ochraceoroseus]PTU18409.1 hypothetical protein P175DRAFT_0465442 [Aspergillus ochraceoroseus IBT 24754]